MSDEILENELERVEGGKYINPIEFEEEISRIRKTYKEIIDKNEGYWKKAIKYYASIGNLGAVEEALKLIQEGKAADRPHDKADPVSTILEEYNKPKNNMEI